MAPISSQQELTAPNTQPDMQQHTNMEQPASHALPSGPPAVTKEPVTEVSLLDILLVLARRRRLILVSTFACATAGLILALLVQPSFTASAVILPPQQSGSSASGMLSELSSLGALGGMAGSSLGIKNPSDMYVALFKSQSVEDGLIRKFGLQNEYKDKLLSVTRKDFEGHAKVVADPKTSLITISFDDHDPNRAAAIANGYIDQYRHLSEHLAISEAAQRRLFFQQQLVEAKNNLSDAEDALLKTQQTTGLVELSSQARALIESAASLRAQIAAKQVQIQGMQTYAAADNAALVQAQGELSGLRSQLAQLAGNGDSSGDELIVPKGKVTTATLEYARRLRDVKYNETIFTLLARQFEMAKLDEAREGALVQVVDPAVAPDHKSSPKRLLWTLIALLLGFFSSAGYVLWRAALRVLHRDPETDSKLQALHDMLSINNRSQGRRL
jgi:tyrosine-protein kinase Etk/Wzc